MSRAEAVGELDPMVWRTDEVARLLAVSDTTVRHMIDRGELAGFRIGRRIVIPKVALTDYIEQRTKAAS